MCQIKAQGAGKGHSLVKACNAELAHWGDSEPINTAVLEYCPVCIPLVFLPA